MKCFLKDYAVTALCVAAWALVALPAHADESSDKARAVDQWETTIGSANAWVDHLFSTTCPQQPTPALRQQCRDEAIAQFHCSIHDAQAQLKKFMPTTTIQPVQGSCAGEAPSPVAQRTQCIVDAPHGLTEAQINARCPR